MYIIMVYIFVSLVHYWEIFAFMFQLLWRIKFRLQLQGIMCRGRRRHWTGGARTPNFLTAGAQHKSVEAVFLFVWIFRRHRRHFCSVWILPLNQSIFFYVRQDGWDEFQEPKKFRIWGSHVWVVDIWWVETAKGIHSESTLSIDITGLQKNIFP